MLHRVLIVGTGSIGERHLRCFQNTNRVDIGIVESNQSLRQQMVQSYALKEAFASLDEALQVRWDAAVVATPAHLHIPMARQLAEEGIHLLIEKPLSNSTEGIVELMDYLERRGIKASVAYVHRAHPLLAAMRQAIGEGKFGKPVELVVTAGHHFPTYRPAYRDIYYRDRSMGGGAIQDALTHLVNAAEWLVGPIDRLVADADHQVLAGVDVEDTVHLIARHGSVLASYSLNQHQAPNELVLGVVCDRGIARYEPCKDRWRWMTEVDGQWHEQKCPPLHRDDLIVWQANAFLDLVEGKADPVCSLAEGFQTLKVNLAALRAVETGTWQTIE